MSPAAFLAKAFQSLYRMAILNNDEKEQFIFGTMKAS